MTPEEAVQNLRKLLESNKAQHVMLVTGKRSFKLSGAAEALQAAWTPGLKITHFDTVPKNPDVKAVDAAAALCGSETPDFVIVVGGGSAIDLAKALLIRLATQEPAARTLNSKTWMDAELVPLVAIPTTTGTGSETTQFAVIYRDKIKHSLSSAKLRPNYVFLVPKFTQAQPFPVRAAAGFDALSQAIESYWSGHGTAESDRAALDAIQLAVPRLTLGLSDFNEEVASDMQQAAHLAGIAINTTKTTAPHALSYALTTDYGVDHGHAVGLLLPKIWRLHNRMAAAGTLPVSLKHRMQDISDRLGVPSHEVPQFIESMLKKNELPFNFRDLGLETQEHWVALCKRVNQDRLKNHPATLSTDDIEALWNHEISDI